MVFVIALYCKAIICAALPHECFLVRDGLSLDFRALVRDGWIMETCPETGERFFTTYPPEFKAPDLSEKTFLALN